MRPASDNLPLSDSRTRQSDTTSSPCSRPLSVADYIQAATAENTRRAHESDLRQFLAWGGTIAWLRSAGIEEGTVFRGIDCHGNVYGDGLSPDSVARIIKKRAAAVGLDPARFSGHSLRAGLVTSAAAAGVPEWAIRRLTGHKSGGMLHRYVRPVDPFNGATVTHCAIDHDEHERGVMVRTPGADSV